MSSRKRPLAGSLFGMPAAIVDAALEQLTPEQRTGINASKAQRIMEVAVSAAGTIGRILEETDHEAAERTVAEAEIARQRREASDL
jgi:hypothetical protein